jgi:hypothetical protein
VNHNTIAIDLDKDTVGDQGEGLHVHVLSNFKINNVIYEGVEVVVICDVRDVAEDMYEFSFKEGTNEARFSKPVLPAPLRMDKAEFDPRVAVRAGAVAGDGFIVDGRDAARYVYHAATTNKGVGATKKTFDVTFPTGYKLSQRAFGNPLGKEDEFTPATFIQYLYRKGIGAGIMLPPPGAAAGAALVEPATFHCQITWRFANAAKDQELVIGAPRGPAAVNASLLGL